MANQKANTDRIIGLSAMLISLLTLLIFIYQTSLMRTQSRLSVKPRLAFSTNINFKDSTATYTSVIINKGLGPAIIESINIVYEGERYALDFERFFENSFKGLEKYGQLDRHATMEKGSTLMAKEKVEMYKFSFSTRYIPEIMKILKISEEDEIPFDIEVVYSSIYEEQWRYSANDEGHPIEL